MTSSTALPLDLRDPSGPSTELAFVEGRDALCGVGTSPLSSGGVGNAELLSTGREKWPFLGICDIAESWLYMIFSMAVNCLACEKRLSIASSGLTISASSSYSAPSRQVRSVSAASLVRNKSRYTKRQRREGSSENGVIQKRT